MKYILMLAAICLILVIGMTMALLKYLEWQYDYNQRNHVSR